MTAPNPYPVAESVSQFLAKPRRMLIGGQWLEAASGRTFPAFDPAMGEPIAQVAEGGAADIDKAVKAARAAFETGPWSRMLPAERTRLIWKLADLIEKHAEEFAQLESLNNGKPLTLARAVDIALAVEHFRYMAGWA
ncbi:MAG TPA: aldehyde dehydrogenase family protein, partial [Polyangiaceae bacterium]|nr:aldehyde dehydrogenase family protein [Polyangiaceae bacterium]